MGSGKRAASASMATCGPDAERGAKSRHIASKKSVARKNVASVLPKSIECAQYIVCVGIELEVCDVRHSFGS